MLLKIMLSRDNVVYICLCVSLLPVFWRIKVFINSEIADWFVQCTDSICNLKDDAPGKLAGGGAGLLSYTPVKHCGCCGGGG